MLIIENLHAGVSDKEIPKGIDLEIRAGEVHTTMGPNGAGKSALSSVISGNGSLEVAEGDTLLSGKNLLGNAPEERVHRGVFIPFQYPVETPGISVTNFTRTAINESRKAQRSSDVPAAELPKRIREKVALLEVNPDFFSRSFNQGFSGGKKKHNEIFQMAMLRPKITILDETDFGLDIDTLRIVANGVNKLKNENNAVLMAAHCRRPLGYIIPDYIHVLFDGKIVKTGDKNLALKSKTEGYDWLK